MPRGGTDRKPAVLRRICFYLPIIIDVVVNSVASLLLALFIVRGIGFSKGEGENSRKTQYVRRDGQSKTAGIATATC